MFSGYLWQFLLNMVFLYLIHNQRVQQEKLENHLNEIEKQIK